VWQVCNSDLVDRSWTGTFSCLLTLADDKTFDMSSTQRVLAICDFAVGGRKLVYD